MSTSRMVGLRTFSVALIAIASAQVHAQTVSSAVTVDGFVTAVPVRTQIRIGPVLVCIGDHTVCKQYTVVTPTRRSSSPNVSDINCASLRLSAGDSLHVIGRWNTTSELSSTTLIQGLPPMPSQQFAVRNPGYQDFFSGGPENGKLTGGSVLEEMPTEYTTEQSVPYTLWLNGFPLAITSQTVWHIQNHPLSGERIAMIQTNNFAHEIHLPQSTAGMASLPRPPLGALTPGVYLSYNGVRRNDGALEASEITIYPRVNRIPRPPSEPRIFTPDHSAGISGEIHYSYGEPIRIIANQAAQQFVRGVEKSLAASSMTGGPALDGSRAGLAVYVIHPFRNDARNEFAAIDGRIPEVRFIGFTGVQSPFALPSGRIITDQIITTPNGTILIPSTLLARLRSSSELAFLISSAMQSVFQREEYIAQIVLKHANGSDFIPPKGISFLLTQQCIRQTIRQMYLAGYDIREAPFAWAVAQGKPVNNPVIDSKDPDKEIPWYAAYAFNYISQYYRDVDYSKLKRGEKEYQQFLQELRKADPEAFAAQARK